MEGDRSGNSNSFQIVLFIPTNQVMVTGWTFWPERSRKGTTELSLLLYILTTITAGVGIWSPIVTPLKTNIPPEKNDAWKMIHSCPLKMVPFQGHSFIFKRGSNFLVLWNWSFGVSLWSEYGIWVSFFPRGLEKERNGRLMEVLKKGTVWRVWIGTHAQIAQMKLLFWGLIIF